MAKETLFDDQEPPSRRDRARATRQKLNRASKKKEVATVQEKRSQDIVPAPAARTLLEVAASAAQNKDLSPEVVREWAAILHEEEARRAKREFDAIMADAQAEIRPVFAASWNSHTRSRYPKLEAVSKVVDPVLRKYRIRTQYGMADSPIDGHYRVILDLSHPCGHTERFVGDFPADVAGAKGTGNKSAVQGVGSTLSYARRYLKTLALDLIISGEDVDADIGDSISDVQAKELRASIEDNGPDEKRFCQVFAIDKLEELPAQRFAEAQTRINQYKANRKSA